MSDVQMQHQPVMLAQTLDALQIKSDGIYIDATFGRGGHSAAILSALQDSQAKLLVFDKDPQAIAHARKLYEGHSQVHICEGCYSNMLEFCRQYNYVGKINGILYDLGVSSPQLDDAARGFSFMRQGPLDMRFDNTTGISAAEWLQNVSEKDLVWVLKNYAEERFAKRIASSIVKHRSFAPLTHTKELAQLIERVVPWQRKQKHPATRSFQAIRIAINSELEILANSLQATIELLAPAGRLAVISFHSLEDRIVKQWMNRYSNKTPSLAKLVIEKARLTALLQKVGVAIKASAEEISANPRARSAILRVVERTTLAKEPMWLG